MPDDAVSAFRRLPLLALLAANVISQVGNVLAAVALPLFVYQTTGSAARVGLTATAAVLPLVLASFFGGTLVDRVGHRRACIAADAASGVAVALVPLLHHTVGLPFWGLLTLVFLGAVLDSPGEAARQSLVPGLAETAGIPLERVNAAYQAVRQAAGLLGPPLAGLLVLLLGTGTVLLLDAATFAASAGLVLVAVPAAVGRIGRMARSPGYWADLRAGVAFLRGERTILTLALLNSAGNLTAAPLFAVVLPVYAARELGGAVSLGVLLAASGIGGLAGSVLYAAIAGRVSRRAIYLGSWAGAAVPLWVLVGAPALVPVMLALVLMGVASSPINPLVYTLTQERTPAALRGRVVGVRIALANVAVPLGMAGVGLLIEVAGLRATLIGLAAVQATLAVIVLLLPALRTIDAPAPNDRQEGTGSSRRSRPQPHLAPNRRWVGLGAAAMAIGSPTVPWLLGQDAVVGGWSGTAQAAGLAAGAAVFALGWIVAAAGLRPGGSRWRGARWGAALYGVVGLLTAVVVATPALLAHQPPIGYPPTALPTGALLLMTLLTWPVVLALALGAGSRRS